METSPVLFAVSGAHMGEELISACGAAADPYRRSMLRLLQYVGLQNYGTPHATVPPRTQAENNAIALHIETVKEATARHEESVRQRNIRINKRKPTNALVDVICSAAMAQTAAVSTEVDNGGDHSTVHSVDNSATSSRQQQPTIYLSFEDSAEWKAFLASVAPSDRLAVTVRRRLTIELWRAHHRNICLWCWFPRSMCMCAQLDAYKAAIPSRVLDQHVEVTMLLHSEELMRSTNSGHIAAYLLGAPIRVWGMDADDFYLRELGPQCYRHVADKKNSEKVHGVSSTPPSPQTAPYTFSSSAATPGASVLVYNVSLYPSSESIMIDEFIRDKHLGLLLPFADGNVKSPMIVEEDECKPFNPSGSLKTTGANASTCATSNAAKDANSSASSITSGKEDAQGTTKQRKIHLILLDSTWGQALSLNRKLSKFIPRVKLEIDDNYASLFQALRKRTRESGVSTLEATSMAVEQCVRAMGYTEEAAQTSHILTAAMKDFVDARCLLKYAAAQFNTDVEALDAFRDKRDDARRYEAARWHVVLSEKMQHDDEARRLRLPPVLNYCYYCDCVIGWHRMAEHVMGRNHRAALERNRACTPSAASRLVVVPDFSRPTRAECTAGWKDNRKAD